MSDLITNIPDFKPGTKPTAEAFNALRDAVANVLAGNILPSSMPWPFIAEGVLDMNGNSIINAASSSNIINVTDSFSLESAIAAVNAAGGGTISINVGIGATIGVLGAEITADNVRITGNGLDTDITVDQNAPYGLRVSGHNFRLESTNIVPTPGGTLPYVFDLLGNNVAFEDVTIEGCDTVAFQLGSVGTSIDIVRFDNILLSNFVSGGVGFKFTEATRVHINDCNARGCSSIAMFFLSGASGTASVSITDISMKDGTGNALLNYAPTVSGAHTSWRMERVFINEPSFQTFSPGAMIDSIFTGIHFFSSVSINICGERNTFRDIKSAAGDWLLINAVDTMIDGCRLDNGDDLLFGVTNSECSLINSHISGSIGSSGTPISLGDMHMIVGNYVGGNVYGLEDTGSGERVRYYHDNHVVGTES